MPLPSVSERARKYVAKMPAAVSGSGGHNDTFHVACVLLQGFDLQRGEARAILDEYNARCAPPWSDKELEHKLNQADKMAGLETRDGMQPRGCMATEIERHDGPHEPRLPSKAASAPLPLGVPKKPEFAPEKLKQFAARWRGFIDTVWLADRSPVEPYSAAGMLGVDGFLRAVFREGEKVVIFTNQQSQGQALWPTQHVPEAGDQGVWYLAQPVDGREHPNPRSKNEDGLPKMSRRSEESVLDWRHLVLESDEADARDWMGALVQLPIPIVAIYTSGGRSIHALARIDAPSKAEWDNIAKQLRPVLVPLGADPKAMSAVRLTRLPGCRRGERLQKLLYLNPAPSPVPLSIAPKLRDSLAPWLSAAATVLSYSPADLGDDDHAVVAKVRAALRWFESAPAAREALAKIDAWGGAEQ